MENIYTYIIKLRSKQLYRLLAHAGFGLIAVAIILTLGVTIPFIQRILSLPAYASIVALLAVLIFTHQKRADLSFLKMIIHSNRDLRRLYTVEYTLLTLPFALFQLLRGNFFVFVALMSLPLLVSFLPQTSKPSKNMKPLNFKVIPLSFFEVRFAVEKRWIIYSIIYLMGYFSFIHLSLLVLCLLGYCLLIIEAFSENENKEMLAWNPSYIIQKWVKYAKLVTAFYITPLLIGFLSHPDQRMLFIYLFAFILVHLFMVISFKYSNYNPIFKTQGNNNMLTLIFVMSVFPGGILISLFFGLYRFTLAKKHLKNLYA